MLSERSTVRGNKLSSMPNVRIVGIITLRLNIVRLAVTVAGPEGSYER